MPLVLVRTPTYRRPELLERAIMYLQAQTYQDWICEVRDDCPESSARDLVEKMADPRVYYVQNNPQKFMVKNLDDCFLRENSHKADYFYMLEDDNQILPTFLSTGCEILDQTGLNICQINQSIEYRGSNHHTTDWGIFDGIYDERVYQPEEIYLAMFGFTGISNGAVFWSKKITRELAVRVNTIPTLEEYLRTRLVSEPMYISREKLAIWASNEQETTRNSGLNKGKMRREVDLKCSINALRRKVWKETPKSMKTDFLKGGILRMPMESRLKALEKSGIVTGTIPSKDNLRYLAIKMLGREHCSVALLS